MSLIVIINAKVGLATAIQTVCNNAGYKTIVADKARVAIEALDATRATVILLGDTDNGFLHEITHLRDNPVTAYVPIVLQSASYLLTNEDYVKRLEVKAVLNDPYSTIDLLEQIAKWVETS